MRTSHRVMAVAFLATAMVAGASACGSGFNDTPEQQSGPADLEILIGSSGQAETDAVQQAAAAWAQSTGNKATVVPAQDLAQQLGQAFAGSNPPDVFYVDAGRFADYAKAGALLPYGNEISDANDFYASLRDAFTFDGQLYCIPKDFSTIAMQINTDLWAQAGLTDADVPTTWDELRAAAEKLKAANITPIVIGDTRDRIGAFMVQAGGWIVNKDGTQATGDSPENLQALQYVQGLIKDGLAVYPRDIDTGWGGEAFGKQLAAITFEGNWIKGALQNDFPDVKYTVNEMPAGPKGKGTLSFTVCWGISAKTQYREQAIDFVRYMTSAEQQIKFTEAFGVMPSRASLRDEYLKQFPNDEAFIAGASYAQGPVKAPKMDSVLSDFDAGLQQLASTDPKALLERLQDNTEAALAG
ncbi:MAG: extracellular solute-binding protein [Micromonosporaceae bacterium]|nr:extracellular solute-binding protein [Micromonosporaceae bacterium]